MELSFREWTEAARWKQSGWTPPPKDAMQQLQMYNQPGYYCTFTYMSGKLGVNPQATFSGGDSGSNITPYGIYAYLVQYVLKKTIKKIPYAADRPYIWIFTPKNPKKIKKIKAVNDKNAQIWNVGRMQSYTLGMFHSYFLKRGIDGFDDRGTGTIHYHEPWQAVFFGSQTINPVTVIDNTAMKDVFKHQYGMSDDEAGELAAMSPMEYK